jgi:glycosyltransferase involved in cell wall biosynthesis
MNLSSFINLPGRVSHFEVPYWIGAFDVCVAPFFIGRNLKIGLSPLKLYEYLACARPVVATELPGITEAVLSSGAGLLYPPGDAVQLAQRFLYLHQFPERARELGLDGRQYVIEYHSWASVAKKTEQILFDLMDTNVN